MVTRRTTQRQFLLRPSKEVNGAIRYCIALAVQKSHVKLHSVIFLSNHYHIILTDPKATLPKFTEELNKLIAKCLNARYSRSENLWAGGTQSSYVLLADAATVLAKSVYALSNPVTAGLVKSGREWPGVRLFEAGKYKATRPAFFFRQNGTTARALSLELFPPPIGGTAIAEAVRRAVREKESLTRREFKATGRKFLGAAAVKRQAITDTPSSPEKRRGISPRVASSDGHLRATILAGLCAFVAAHAQARKAWCRGIRSTIFPWGTYRMRVVHACACADG